MNERKKKKENSKTVPKLFYNLKINILSINLKIHINKYFEVHKVKKCNIIYDK